jgi:hypothetical protein
MGGVGGRAAGVLLAAVVTCLASSHRAVADAIELDGTRGERFLFFSGMDLWRSGGFVYGGALFAANGLDDDGAVFKLLLNGGRYDYRSGALGNAEVTGRQFGVYLLGGRRWKRDALTLTLFAGLDAEHHSQSPDDPGAGLRGGEFGAMAAVEAWYEPAPNLMLAADASVSSVGPRFNARVAFGVRVLDRFYLGPEIQRFATDDYHQMRYGVHLTGLRTQAAEWSAALGWADDSDDRSGVYSRLGVSVRY